MREQPYPVSLTVEEVAGKVGVHKNTVLNAIGKGHLEAWRPGEKELRIEPDALEDWKRRRRVSKPKPSVRSRGLRALEGGKR